MIDLTQLREKDIGGWVEYHANNGKVEQGRIKSWNNKFIFVVYHCNGEWERFQDFTGAATNSKNLVFKEV